MKSLLHDAGSKPKPKRSVQDHPAKLWGTAMNTSVHSPRRRIKRSDGSISIDKTHGMNSRPHKKQQLRNANRSITKSARQKLKKQLKEEVQEIISPVKLDSVTNLNIKVSPTGAAELSATNSPKVEPETNKPLGFFAATKEVSKFIFTLLFSPDHGAWSFGMKIKFIFALLGHIINPFK